jgi:hypothetical protein
MLPLMADSWSTAPLAWNKRLGQLACIAWLKQAEWTPPVGSSVSRIGRPPTVAGPTRLASSPPFTSPRRHSFLSVHLCHLWLSVHLRHLWLSVHLRHLWLSVHLRHLWLIGVPAARIGVPFRG